MVTAGRNAQAGFTLIEVVVALAILGAGLVILLETHYASLGLFDEALDQATLALMLETAAAEAERSVLSGTAGGDGEFGARFPGYTYSFASSQVAANEMPGLLEIQVTVKGPATERQVIFHVYDGTQVAEDGTAGQSGTARQTTPVRR